MNTSLPDAELSSMLKTLNDLQKMSANGDGSLTNTLMVLGVFLILFMKIWKRLKLRESNCMMRFYDENSSFRRTPRRHNETLDVADGMSLEETIANRVKNSRARKP